MKKLTAVALAAIALAACGKPAGKTTQITIPGANGQSVVIGNVAPENLPAFVKLYPGAKVTASTTTPKGGLVTMETNDTPDKVIDFYKQGAAGAGLTVQMDSSAMGGQSASRVVVFGPPETNGTTPSTGNSLTATVTVENGVTKVGLLYGES